MKKIILISFVLLCFIYNGVSQTQPGKVQVPMMGEEAPSFTAESTQGIINFPADYPMQWKILFSHPADFTPVCTTEILELAALQEDIKKLKTALVVISVDPVETHEQWIRSMEDLNYKDRNVKINFPIVGDVDKNVSRQYGMLQANSSDPRDVRGVFIIDPNDKVRAMYFYPMNVGRNLEEVKRLLVALQVSDKKQVMTPANWQPGGDVLLPYAKNKDQADKLTKTDDPDYYRVAWYMNFKKLSE